jgi:hypothetical protein
MTMIFKVSFISFLLVLTEALGAQKEFQFPTIPAEPVGLPSPFGFIPTGWDFLTITNGNLNSYGFQDYMMILVPGVKKEGYNLLDWRYYTSKPTPKIIMAASYDTITRKYNVLFQNNVFLYRNVNTSIAEPFNFADIDSSGALILGFRFLKKKLNERKINTQYKFYFRLMNQKPFLNKITKQKNDLMTHTITDSVIYETPFPGKGEIIWLADIGSALTFQITGKRVLEEANE